MNRRARSVSILSNKFSNWRNISSTLWERTECDERVFQLSERGMSQTEILHIWKEIPYLQLTDVSIEQMTMEIISQHDIYQSVHDTLCYETRSCLFVDEDVDMFLRISSWGRSNVVLSSRCFRHPSYASSNLMFHASGFDPPVCPSDSTWRARNNVLRSPSMTSIGGRLRLLCYSH